MGVYIKPKKESPEDFLDREGMEIPRIDSFDKTPKNWLPVVVTDNGKNTVAAIVFDEREFELKLLSDGSNPKKIYLVPIVKLLKMESKLKDHLKTTVGV